VSQVPNHVVVCTLKLVEGVSFSTESGASIEHHNPDTSRTHISVSVFQLLLAYLTKQMLLKLKEDVGSENSCKIELCYICRKSFCNSSLRGVSSGAVCN